MLAKGYLYRRQYAATGQTVLVRSGSAVPFGRETFARHGARLLKPRAAVGRRAVGNDAEHNPIERGHAAEVADAVAPQPLQRIAESFELAEELRDRARRWSEHAAAVLGTPFLAPPARGALEPQI